MAVPVGSLDPLEHLVDRVSVGEHVVRRLPVAVLVGIAEARHSESRSVGERSAEVSRSSACADRCLERVEDLGRIVIEQLSGERRVVRPAMRAATASKQFRQFPGHFLTQRNKINRLAPRSRFVGATGGHHLADDSRQQSRGVLPADEIKALERLVYEVERVSRVGECSLGFGCKQGIGEHCWRATRCNRREQGALGRLAVPHVCPASQPAVDRGRIRTARKRCAFPPRRLAVAVRRHAARAVKQGEIRFLVWQRGQNIGERRQDREAHAPAVAVARPK
jgi:hypothetical protein